MGVSQAFWVRFIEESQPIHERMSEPRLRQMPMASKETSNVTDYNQTNIDEFRANDGKIGGNFEGAPMILVHHVGAKTGTKRVNPLTYQAVDGGYAVFASKAGADTNPDWFYNLKANPETVVEVGTETISVTARVATGEERDRIFSQQKQNAPVFVEYEKKTSRVIPVVVLEPKS